MLRMVPLPAKSRGGIRAAARDPPLHLQGRGTVRRTVEGPFTRTRTPSTMLRMVPLPAKSRGGIRAWLILFGNRICFVGNGLVLYFPAIRVERDMAGHVRGKRRQFTAERREGFIGDLRRTGNHASAARAAGITDGGARRYRRRLPEFEALCIAAVREARQRTAGAEGPFDECVEAAFESIRRSSDGRLKIQAKGTRRWSRNKEEMFFEVLRECGNVRASAAAAGVSA